MSDHATMKTFDDQTMQNYDKCGPSKRCNNGKLVSFNLFGVPIDPNLTHEDDKDHQEVISSSLRKSKSMEIMNVCDEHTQNEVIRSSIRRTKSMEIINLCNNDLSDDHQRKGVPWTEDEHRSFLIGLDKLGKGDWRGISKNYVPSRTPTQVASHAQKYFNRINASQEKAKRKSLFDMAFNESPKVPIAPTITSSARPPPPVSRINGTYDVRDYGYMHAGYQNRNEQRFVDPNMSPMLSFVPVMSYPNQSYVYPLNRGMQNQLFTDRSQFLSRVQLPITHGERRITEEKSD